MFLTITNVYLCLNWIVFNRTDYLHKMDLALNNLQRLICHKHPTNQTLKTVWVVAINIIHTFELPCCFMLMLNYKICSSSTSLSSKYLGCLLVLLIGWFVSWHIKLCRLFKFIFIHRSSYISNNLVFSWVHQFYCQKYFYFKLSSLVEQLLFKEFSLI